MEPFRIDVAEDVLDDLRVRLERTRYPPTVGSGDRASGVRPDELRELVEAWKAWDWRATETRLNSYPQFRHEGIHFVRLANPGRPAIILSHGWPYTFAEMLPLVDALSADFEVVVPSLPGYTYSALLDGPVLHSTIAQVWNRLMRELGHERYLTYGEDIGAGVSDWLAASYPSQVVGIIASHAAFPPPEREQALGPEEEAFLVWLDAVWEGGTGYGNLQANRPDTLAAGLSDSPAGLLAWVVEKLREWSDIELSTDQLLTPVSLFWVTNSIRTSFRSYSDNHLEPPLPMIDVPAAIIVQQHEREYPRAMAERTYTDIRSFQVLDRGGHFTATEAPDAVAATIRNLAAQVGQSAADVAPDSEGRSRRSG